MKQNWQFPSILVTILLLARLTSVTEAVSEHLVDKYQNEIVDSISIPNEQSETGSSSQCIVHPKQFPSNCAEATANSHKSGLYTIQVDGFENGEPFKVFCDEDTQDGGWTVIQRRLDGSIDFYRDWLQYKLGFGNLAGEFFIGLAKIHVLTTYTKLEQELLIVMEDFENVTRFAKYESFAIGNEAEGYALKVLGQYSGDAGDSLTTLHASYEFATKDRDNSRGCANKYLGGWWYGLVNCHDSHLNGQYLHGECTIDDYGKGIVWNSFRGQLYSLKSVKMMIRPKRH